MVDPTGPQNVASRVNETAGRWLEQHGDVLYGFALRRLGEPESAEDAVQEALATGLGSLDTFRKDSSERTWLVGILRHKIQHVLRRSSRERTFRTELAESMGGRIQSFGERSWKREPADWDKMPIETMESSEFRETLFGCIDQLPPVLRSAFCLRELDGLSTEEVCGLLGVTATNLWTLIHRAKLRIRDCLTQKWYK
jgi:RNA polymerase sigma-70 factor, ECF subfamily